jgi:2-polyprenyl-3-methyl-5-hydroxy-6-metoxy-1,4-benzoquinol methylase
MDFGCGYGQNITALKQLGYKNIAGYDIEPSAIEWCKKNDLNVVDGRECALGEIVEKYDVVIMTHVLEHIPKDDIINTLLGLQGVLKDGGLLFVAVPNAQSNTGCYWAYEDFTHHTLFTAGSLYYVMKLAGYSKVELIDPDCLDGTKGLKKLIRQFFLSLYRMNMKFWNKVTGSAYHAPSPIVNSYEIKMVAWK